MSSPVFLPKTLTVLRGYSRSQFARDSVAGLTVAFVALPLALALGIGSIDPGTAASSGVSPPVAGLITAIVAGLLISALGGTRAAVGGPTAAFVVIVASIAQEHGFAGLSVATIMAGLLLIALGIARMGAMIKFIPYPVTTGFTAGIGVTILVGQVKDFFGMHVLAEGDAPIPPHFFERLQWLWTHATTIHWPTAATAAVCVAVIVLWPRFVTRRVPSPIVVLVGATLAAQVFGLPLETIGDRFGRLPTEFPTPRLPEFEWSMVPKLVGPAFTIAMLASIESLLCAVVADGMLGTRHRSNTELIAQGIANCASPLFGGIPATGAIARTATNIQSGGRTPVAGMIHAAVLLVVMLAMGSLAERVPLAVLAAILVVVAWRMAEVGRVIWLVRGPRHDAMVLLSTLALTVFTDLTIAVGVGIVMASLLFMKRMSDVAQVSVANDGSIDAGLSIPDETGRTKDARLPGVEVYDINGPFFFGAAFKLRDTLDSLGKPPKALIVNMPNVTAVDATGLHALEELKRRCDRDGTAVILAGVHSGPMTGLARAGMLDEFGDANLVGTLDEAMERARAVIGASQQG